MSTTAGSIACRMCLRHINVTFKRAPGSAVSDNWASMLLDMRPLIAHYNSCAYRRPEYGLRESFQVLAGSVRLSVPEDDLSARINTILNVADPYGGRHFVARGGSRACTMCGRLGEECLTQLTSQARANPGKGGTPCCAACSNGNTHPAPLEAFGMCSEWGAEYGVGGPRYAS